MTVFSDILLYELYTYICHNGHYLLYLNYLENIINIILLKILMVIFDIKAKFYLHPIKM